MKYNIFKQQPISSINMIELLSKHDWTIVLIINVVVSLKTKIHMNDDFPYCTNLFLKYTIV